MGLEDRISKMEAELPHAKGVGGKFDKTWKWLAESQESLNYLQA